MRQVRSGALGCCSGALGCCSGALGCCSGAPGAFRQIVARDLDADSGRQDGLYGCKWIKGITVERTIHSDLVGT